MTVPPKQPRDGNDRWTEYCKRSDRAVAAGLIFNGIDWLLVAIFAAVHGFP
jgi:hypothetical protein